MQKIPFSASKYIREHFREGQLGKVTSYRSSGGHTVFKINLVENDIVYRLEFNEKGKLLKRESEPLYKEDYFEGSFYGREDA